MEFYGMTGERLGTIGEQRSQVVDSGAQVRQLPKWKQDFLAKPSISIRKGIAWSYDPPYEDTSTLVLTSSSSSFIDVRFPLQVQSKSALKDDPAFWAFSGKSKTTFAPDNSKVTMPYSAHSVWQHDIDSKGPGISDEGDLFLLQNGDCMEVGMMPNPTSGKLELYKEYWTTPESEPESGTDGSSVQPCIVAQTISSSTSDSTIQTRGLVIRIGDYCQGILTRNNSHDEILVERWINTKTQRHPAFFTDEAEATTWLKDQRSTTDNDPNNLDIPCMWVCEIDRRIKDRITVKEAEWEITELSK